VDRNEDVGVYLSVSNLLKACCQTFHAPEMILQGFGVPMKMEMGREDRRIKKRLYLIWIKIEQISFTYSHLRLSQQQDVSIKYTGDSNQRKKSKRV